MKLTNNPKWKEFAENNFSFNTDISKGNEIHKVDYAHKNNEGKLICYGFDFPNDNVTKEEIYYLLVNEKKNNGELTLISRMYNLANYGYSLFVFLVTKNKIFYMPYGINQVNPDCWEFTDDIRILLEKSKMNI
jgi:hypothetical protein